MNKRQSKETNEIKAIISTLPLAGEEGFIVFKKLVWDYYALNKRSFAWRDQNDPYKIVVSEIMLQQTQTYRVAPKYEYFIKEFPNFYALANATLHDVLSAWQGLGYNRRGLALQKIAQRVMNDFDGKLPNCPATLETFPGIGKATAGSICAFAFNMPTIFIETNIRAVFIHFFMSNQEKVYDKQLISLVEATIDKKNPRQWYYALMDYGVMLKGSFPNPSRKSAHHARQSKFEGSDRQIRGMILKLLTQHSAISYYDLYAHINRPVERIEKAVRQLIDENFIEYKNAILTIKN